MEKVLVTSIFLYSYNVFYPFWYKSHHLCIVLMCFFLFFIQTGLKFCRYVNSLLKKNSGTCIIQHTCQNFFRQIRDNGLHFPGFAYIFQDRTNPPPPLSTHTHTPTPTPTTTTIFFPKSRPAVIFRYAKTHWCKIVKNLINRRATWNF